MFTQITPRDLWYALGLSGILVGIILLFMAGYYLIINPRKRRQKVVERLEEASAEHLRRIQILKEGMETQQTFVGELFRRMLGKRYLAKIQSRLLQADIYWTPAAFILLVVTLGCLGFAIGVTILRNALFGLMLMPVLAVIPILYVRHRMKKKTEAFERQMPDAMELLARSLRAGHTLPSAIELLSKEMLHPMGTEMRVTYEEQRFGISIPDSLINMQERVDSDDLRYLVTAVVIQHETGGNIVEIMEKIGAVIRSRLNFKVKIKAFTAEGRLSAAVLICLPVFLFLFLLLIKYDYEKALLFDELGRKFLMAGIFMLIGGAYVMRRIIRSVEM